MIERHMDYFAASLVFPELSCRKNGYKIVAAIPFYKRGYQDEIGCRYYYGNPNSKKALAVLSGQACAALRNEGNSDGEIVGAFLNKGARCSRLDLAVTEYVEESLITLEAVEQWFTDGLINSAWVSGGCKAIVDIPSQGDRATQTLYIGSMDERGKKGIFRAYDKGVEMDLGQHMITRLEIEDRGDKAAVSAKRLSEGASVASVFRTRFDVNDPEFERLMQAPVADMSRGAAKPKVDEIEARNKRWYWLINQIAPSIKQALADDKRLELGDEMFTKFLVASGLMAEMRGAAADLANRMYRDTLERNGLLETDFSE
jgi:hypothetical protein